MISADGAGVPVRRFLIDLPAWLQGVTLAMSNAERVPVTIAIAGDVMLGRPVNEAIAAHGAAYPWGDLLPRLRKVDLLLVNLECALTRRTERWRDGEEKAFYFRAHPAAVLSLTTAGVDFVSLANNHAGDFGIEGLLETLRVVLDAEGIAHAGAGLDLAGAQAPASLAARGTNVAVLAFADYPGPWSATATGPGINWARSPRRLRTRTDPGGYRLSSGRP